MALFIVLLLKLVFVVIWTPIWALIHACLWLWEFEWWIFPFLNKHEAFGEIQDDGSIHYFDVVYRTPYDYLCSRLSFIRNSTQELVVLRRRTENDKYKNVND